MKISSTHIELFEDRVEFREKAGTGVTVVSIRFTSTSPELTIYHEDFVSISPSWIGIKDLKEILGMAKAIKKRGHV